VQGPGPATARDDIVALATEQDLTEGGVLAGVGVAAERHPAAAVAVAVPEHHRLHGHGRAEMVRDAMELTVGLGPRRVPRREHVRDRRLHLPDRQVEDGGHHAGHRLAPTGADRHRQRPAGGFQVGDGRRQLDIEAIGQPPVAEEGAACPGADDEPWGHGQAKPQQDDKAVRLAAEDLRRLLGRGRQRPDPPHRGMPRVASRSSCSWNHTAW
jgi:hypothetical protein